MAKAKQAAPVNVHALLGSAESILPTPVRDIRSAITALEEEAEELRRDLEMRRIHVAGELEQLRTSQAAEVAEMLEEHRRAQGEDCAEIKDLQSQFSFVVGTIAERTEAR